MQSVVMIWYVTEGYRLPEAAAEEALMGPWDSDCSLRHVIRVLRRAILNATISGNSDDPQEVTRWLEVLKNDKRAIFSAAAHAQRAADYLSGLQGKDSEQAAA